MRIKEVYKPIRPTVIAGWLGEMRVFRANSGTIHLSDVGGRSRLTRCGRDTNGMAPVGAGERWATLASTAQRCGSCARIWQAYLDHAA